MGQILGGNKKDSQSTTATTNAKEAWSQLLYSVVSDNPPPKMSREYYYERPVPIRIIQEQLKRFGIKRYNLGAANAQPAGDLGPRVPRNRYHQEIRHIQDRLEFLYHSGNLHANNDRYQQSTEQIQNLMRIISNELVQASKRDFSEEWQGGIFKESIKHIYDLTWTIRNAMTSILDDVVLLADEDKLRQGIEYVQFLTRRNRVRVDDEVVQENKYKYQQGIEDIQSAMRSIGFRVDDEVVQENEDIYEKGIEDIQSAMRSIGLRVDDKLVEANEDIYQQGIEDIQPVMRSIGFRVDSEAVQANEDKYRQGIEDIQPVTRTIGFCVDENEGTCQQGIEDIQSFTRSNVGNELVQKKGNYHQGNEHIQSVTGTIADEEMVQACEAENQIENEHEREVLLSLLAFVEFVEDQIWEEHLTLRSEVREAYELMHENGVADTVRSQLEGKDPKLQYQEKRLELLLRICDQEICLKSIQLQKVGEDVYCKHCVLSRTSEEGNQLGISHGRELSNLFADLLKLVENGDVHREEKPAVPVKVLKLIKVLHHYGVDTIRNAVENELEDVKRKYEDTVEAPSIQIKNKALKVMLRICSNESYERTISDIVRKSKSYIGGFNNRFLFATMIVDVPSLPLILHEPATEIAEQNTPELLRRSSFP